MSDQTIYNWRRQEAMDRGLETRFHFGGANGTAGRPRRIDELENELAVTKRAIELLKAKAVSPKDGTK